MTADLIPFNRPFATGKDIVYAAEAQRNFHLCGDGAFTKRRHQWIEQRTGCAKAPLTHSRTSALDLAALLVIRIIAPMLLAFRPGKGFGLERRAGPAK